MSNSSTLLDLISSSQSAKEVTANALFDAGSMAALFGRRASTTSALTWGYYGGTLGVSGVLTSVANGTIALFASGTNYVESTTAGVVSVNTTAFTTGRIQLYSIVTGVSSVTSYTDCRAYGFSAASGAAVSSVSVVSANGLGGTVATPTTTPAITLSTSITGVLKGNGTAISAAVAGTDYQLPITLTTTGSSGAATFGAGVLNIPSYSAGGGGSVTSTSVVSANGFAGTVATATSTPAITITTSITGLLKGNGTALSAAVVNVDYLPPPSGGAILKAGYGGALGNAVANADYLTPPLGSSILKAGAGGALASASAGTDFQAPITLTTTGSSGAATFSAGTLNIPNYAGGGGGSVTSASVVSANGFAGTVATASSTPAITITTSVTGLVKGDGTSLSAAVVNVDYLPPPSGGAILKAGYGGALGNAVANTDYLTPPLGTSLVKAGAGGALGNASSGTDYTVGTASLASGLLKSTAGTGNISIAAAGTDFQAPISLTTTGTSGVATFSTGTLNIPNYSGLLLSGGTMTGSIALAAGTTSLSPLKFTSGTNLTTATAGTLEYDGSVFYASIAASTNGAITLPVGCYEFECRFALTALSATSGSFGFAMGGAATFTQQWYSAAAKAATLATAATWQQSYNVAANTTLATASVQTNGTAIIRGRLNVTATGTVIPQVSLTQLATPTVSAGSFFRVFSVSASNGATNILVGNWS